MTKKSPKALTFWRLNSLHCIERTSLESTISSGGHDAILADALFSSHIRVSEHWAGNIPSTIIIKRWTHQYPIVNPAIQCRSHSNFLIFPNTGNRYLHEKTKRLEERSKAQEGILNYLLRFSSSSWSSSWSSPWSSPTSPALRRSRRQRERRRASLGTSSTSTLPRWRRTPTTSPSRSSAGVLCWSTLTWYMSQYHLWLLLRRDRDVVNNDEMGRSLSLNQPGFRQKRG